MTKILFICHGNICRSPMAEFIMKEIVQNAGLRAAASPDDVGDIYIESAATSTEELGNPVYPPAKAVLASHGISCDGKRARRIRPDDYEKYDHLIGMDDANIRNMLRMFGSDPEHKISKLLDHAGSGRDVADPWYTRDFTKTYEDIKRGCEALFEVLIQSEKYSMI